MDWVEEFYSLTGTWWGDAEADVRAVDRARAQLIHDVAPASSTVLELGCGYGATALAVATTGRHVVGIDLSDRINRAVARTTPNATFVHADFFVYRTTERFDVVCYWDGFGVGRDADQQRLLKRIADEWLASDGIVIIEVFHPEGWSSDDGLEEVKAASPADGYAFRLGHRRDFDPTTSRAIDTWWEIGSKRRASQSLRCYQPEEFASLAAEAGLEVVDPDRPLPASRPKHSDEPTWSYVSVLRRRS